MTSQIQLQIGTGNGNNAIVINLGSTPTSFDSIFAIAFGSATAITGFHLQLASAVAIALDPAIVSIRDNRSAYSALTAIEQASKQNALDFCVKWRDACREHPNCYLYIIP
jgi:hypothetical protein